MCVVYSIHMGVCICIYFDSRLPNKIKVPIYGDALVNFICVNAGGAVFMRTYVYIYIHTLYLRAHVFICVNQWNVMLCDVISCDEMCCHVKYTCTRIHLGKL